MSHVKEGENNNSIGPFVSFDMPPTMGPLANIIAEFESRYLQAFHASCFRNKQAIEQSHGDCFQTLHRGMYEDGFLKATSRT